MMPLIKRLFMKRVLLLVIVFFFLSSGGYYLWHKSTHYVPESVPVETDVSQVQQQSTPASTPTSASGATSVSNTSPTVAISSDQPPTQMNLKMTFYSQAPFANWDLPWQEACEEASSLLVANVYKDKQWTREEFNQELLRLVEWEKGHFGTYLDTNAAQTAEMLSIYFGLHTKIHENPTLDDVKSVIARGHFVIMPFAGKKLVNPFYNHGGPEYHMLVVKGYKDGNRVITNDVGTKNGENYVYSWETIENALHDYTNPIENGAKRMIEVLP